MSDLPDESLTREQSGPAFDRALARAVRLLRTERGLGRRQLAEQAGLSYTYLSEIETGKKRPPAQRLLAIAQALGLRPHELMALAETMIAEEAAPTAPTKVIGAPLKTQARFFHAPPAEEEHGLAALASSSPRSRASAMATPPGQAAQAQAPPAAAEALRELRLLLARLAPEDIARVLDLARRLGRP